MAAAAAAAAGGLVDRPSDELTPVSVCSVRSRPTDHPPRTPTSWEIARCLSQPVDRGQQTCRLTLTSEDEF